MPTKRPSNGDTALPFLGFQNLTANFVYCPNQFFDVCLPHHSRGVVRLVGYLIRKTLGWLEENGNPIDQDIRVSYRELIGKAGISRGALRTAIDEAVNARMIGCCGSGKTNVYTLRWDAESQYTNDPKAFNGFFAGEGHRSPIPNAFFDQIVARETLATVKIVGTVLRHTVGYQNQFGGRRSHAPLSYSYIQKYANLSDRTTLASALRTATKTGYIQRVQQGHFNPRSDNQIAASYAVRWLDEANLEYHGSKTRPALEDQFKKPTSAGSKTRPANRFKNQTIEKTDKKNTCKQQHQEGSVLSAVAAENSKSYLLLTGAGFDRQIAIELSRKQTPEDIEQQIEWLDARNPRKNRLGLLRRAIEENWSQPEAAKSSNEAPARQRDENSAQKRSIEAARQSTRKHERLQRRQTLLCRWRNLPIEERKRRHQAAIDRATSDALRTQLRRRQDLENPSNDVLALLAGEIHESPLQSS